MWFYFYFLFFVSFLLYFVYEFLINIGDRNYLRRRLASGEGTVLVGVCLCFCVSLHAPMSRQCRRRVRPAATARTNAASVSAAKVMRCIQCSLGFCCARFAYCAFIGTFHINTSDVARIRVMELETMYAFLWLCPGTRASYVSLEWLPECGGPLTSFLLYTAQPPFIGMTVCV